MKKYKLLKDIPGLKAGAIFEHDANDDEKGSAGYGCLKLSWIDGDCQQGWCAETHIFPGQLIEDKKWFKKISKNQKENSNSDKVNELNFLCYFANKLSKQSIVIDVEKQIELLKVIIYNLENEIEEYTN